MPYLVTNVSAVLSTLHCHVRGPCADILAIVQQLCLPQADVDAIVQRLSAQTQKAKSGNWQPKAVAVKLTYVRDAAKGHKEAYVPVKKVLKTAFASQLTSRVSKFHLR